MRDAHTQFLRRDLGPRSAGCCQGSQPPSRSRPGEIRELGRRSARSALRGPVGARGFSGASSADLLGDRGADGDPRDSLRSSRPASDGLAPQSSVSREEPHPDGQRPQPVLKSPSERSERRGRTASKHPHSLDLSPGPSDPRRPSTPAIARLSSRDRHEMPKGLVTPMLVALALALALALGIDLPLQAARASSHARTPPENRLAAPRGGEKGPVGPGRSSRLLAPTSPGARTARSGEALVGAGHQVALDLLGRVEGDADTDQQ